MAQGWAGAAMKRLQLICVHDSSLVQTTVFDPENKSPEQQIVSQRIVATKVTVVEMQRGNKNLEMLSFKHCIKALVAKEPTLNEGVLETILGKSFHERQVDQWVGVQRWNRKSCRRLDDRAWYHQGCRQTRYSLKRICCWRWNHLEWAMNCRNGAYG